MKKLVNSVLVILLVVGLPVFFILNFGSGATGAVSNELGELRMRRMQLYLDFPLPMNKPVERQLSDNVRNFLRAGSKGAFYASDRLKFGDEFFDNERVLFVNLMKLSCLSPAGRPPRGAFVTGNVMRLVLLQNVFFDVDYKDLQISCDPSLSSYADFVMQSVLALDAHLVKVSIDSSRCSAQAVVPYSAAIDAISVGNVESAIVNLHVAWKAVENC